MGIILYNIYVKHKHHHSNHVHSAHAIAKTVALVVAVILMLPVANSWQQMSGSLQNIIGSVLPVL